MLYICIACILTALVAALMNPFLRLRLKQHEKPAEKVEMPPVSIIMLSDRDAHKLDQRLDAVLSQDYNQAFEVIVITEKSDSEVQDVLKRRASDARIRSTFVPLSSRYMSRTKLAVTLGVKAAQFEWIILLDANTRPQSSKWLQNMGSHMTDNHNIILGYSNYGIGDSKAYHRFERLFTASYLLRSAQRGLPYRANSTNFAFRKSEFIRQDGYRGNLQFARGEYDFLINKYARKGASDIEISPEAMTVEAGPYSKQWRDTHLSYLYHHKSLKRWFPMHMLTILDQTILHISYCFLVAALVYAIVNSQWLLVGSATASLLLLLVLRTWLAHRVAHTFNAHLPVALLPLLELSITWHSLWFRLRLLFADKIDFTSHRL